jgi:hypothetical protein
MEETMRNIRINNILKIGKVGFFVLSVLILCVFYPMTTWAEEESSKKLDEDKATHPQSEDAETPGFFDRFQVELYGGIVFLNPSDLNLFVNNDNQEQEFFYDSYFDFLVAKDQIESWTQNQAEERKEIRRSYPIGGRIKYYLSETIALSLGFRYMSSTHTLDLDFQYFRNELSDERYEESIRYSPYSLSAKAYIPSLGIHILKRLNDSLLLEGFICGGPMFADCRYLSDWSYEWVTEGPGYRYLTYSSLGILEEEGSGTGIAIDLGGRLNYPVFRSFEIFLEASYAYQVVKSISGSGREDRDGRITTWDGRWGIKSETGATGWGELESEFPTSYWPDNSEAERLRDFELDLSGFQLRLGLAFRF